MALRFDGSVLSLFVDGALIAQSPIAAVNQPHFAHNRVGLTIGASRGREGADLMNVFKGTLLSLCSNESIPSLSLS